MRFFSFGMACALAAFAETEAVADYTGGEAAPYTTDAGFTQEQIHAILASQENLLRDIQCEFESTWRTNGKDQVTARTTGQWLYSSVSHLQKIDLQGHQYQGDKETRSEHQVFSYDGKEMREWSDSNNSGNFSTHDKANSSAVSAFEAPFYFFLSPLRQEAPFVTYADLLNPRGCEDLPKGLVQVEILGKARLETETEAVDAVVVDIGVGESSFRLRVWLDPARSFAPRRLLQYMPDRPEYARTGPLIDIITDEYLPVSTPEGGVLYVPKTGRMAGIRPEGRGCKYSETMAFRLTADPKINAGLTGEAVHFPWPENCRVLNIDSGEWGYWRGDRLVPGRMYNEK